MGELVGDRVGNDVAVVGAGVGTAEGADVGRRVGDDVGWLVGDGVGDTVGEGLGLGVGVRVGASVSGTPDRMTVCVTSSAPLTFTFTSVTVSLAGAIKMVRPRSFPTTSAVSVTGGGGSWSPAMYSVPSRPTTTTPPGTWRFIDPTGIAW